MENKWRVSFHIHKLCRHMDRYLENYGTAKKEITRTQGMIIRYLCDNSENDIFQKDIESFFNTRRSTVSVALTTLEKNGYVLRQSVDSDARLKKIVATEKAKRLHLAICDEFDRFDLALIEGIDEKDIDTFLRVVSKIKENIEKNEERADTENA